MKYVIATIMTLVMLMSVSYAYAENFTVSVNGDGFSQSSLTIGQGDSVTFTTDIAAPYSVAITDVLNQIETGMIGHHAFDDEHPVTWTFDTCMTHVFEDQYNQFSPMTLIVDCSEPEVPEYTGEYTLLSLQQELAQVTADLNLAIEEAGLLQNVVSGLTSDLASSQSQNTTLQLELTSTQQELSDLANVYDETANQQIQSLTLSVESLETANSDLISERDALVIERDGWKQLSDNWYAVALEQVRVMVEVLGL